MSADFDHQMMGLALGLARRGLGETAPNPSVGAVLADEAAGQVVACGRTGAGGRPHAERIAIEKAGVGSRGATLYVTLEPCSHHGQTPPCADAVIEAGIKRVVVAITDPDPRVAGRGIAKLRAAGIAVERGVRAGEAFDLTRGHILRVSERRPFVQVKLALGPDGSVPLGANGRPQFVTSAQSRALGHLLRARADAIVAGHGTVQADNPELTCRLPGLAHRSPVRVVLARRGLSLSGISLAADLPTVPVWVITGPDVADTMVAAMKATGAKVCQANEVGNALWLPSVVEGLAARGITRLLVEGGRAVWRSFTQAGLVDEVVLFVASSTVGDDVAMNYARRHLGSLPLVVADRRSIGPDTFVRFTVTSNPGAQPLLRFAQAGPGHSSSVP